jgi:hypothetical protein
MLDGILLIILGILAVPSLLLSKKPNAKELLDKITPFQGWIGVGFCIWGVIGTIFSIIGLAGYISLGLWGIIFGITVLACSVVMAVLGFLLGYGLIVKYVLSKNEQAAAKGEQLLAKLAPMQGKFGIAAIILGVWCIVCSFLYAAAVAVVVATA